MPVNISDKGLQSLVKSLSRVANNVPVELRRASQVIRRNAITESRTAATDVYTLSKSRFAKDLTVTASDLTVTLIGSRKPITVMSYKGRQLKKTGLHWKILKSGPSWNIPRGFVAKKAPFIREGKKRKPIKVIQGPSAADILNNKAVLSPLTKKLTARAIKEIERRIGSFR